MFTGITESWSIVSSVSHLSGTHYTLSLPFEWISALKVGASLSVHGVCQTITKIEGNIVHFDAIEETKQCTTLGALAVGDRVNIERSVRLGEEIGGHLLSGHIIGMGEVSQIITSNDTILTISCPASYMKYILKKGFIALNGVSLTVVETNDAGWFTVHLIPETLKKTTFDKVQLKDKVNIEIDYQTQVIVSTIERILDTKEARCADSHA